MPNFDKTGPRGEGPQTGRGRGSCAQNNSDVYRGQGRGQGRGRCYGNGNGYGNGHGQGRGRGLGRRQWMNADNPS